MPCPNFVIITSAALLPPLRFGVDAGSSFRAEQRMSGGEVSGVYSWQKPDGSDALIAYLTGQTQGYREGWEDGVGAFHIGAMNKLLSFHSWNSSLFQYQKK